MPRLSRPPAQGPLVAPGLTGLLTGRVATWNSADGYTVTVGGADVATSTVLASAGSLSPGDLVAVLRHKSTVLVLGKITAPA